MKSLVNKMKNKKGFTLMEMLIVVAIMVILVAVSIPVFTNQLDNAKKTTDNANIRAAKQAMLTEYMINQHEWVAGTTDTIRYYNAETGTLATSDTGIEAYGQGTTTNDLGTNSKDAILKLEMEVDEGAYTGIVTMSWE